MKKYTVENDEGKQVTFEWDDDNNPPTDSDMEEVFAASKISVPKEEPPLPEEKEGYFSGINKAMDETAFEGAKKNLVPEKYPMQHAVQNLNTLVRIPLSGLAKAAEPITKPLQPLGKKLLDDFTYSGGDVEGSFDRRMQEVAPTIKKYKDFESKHPVFDAATDFVGDVGELAGNVAGIGGAAKVGTALGKEAIKVPAKVGSGLESAGKNFKLGDMKIKDSIAKKGYGGNLIEKKQNIANTIQDWGLTHGGNKGGYEKAGEIITDIHTKADDITIQLATDPNIELTNPVKIASENLDIKSLPAGKRKQAQAIADDIISDLKAEGLNDNLTVDKLIQAKRSIDTKGLFSNGPGLSGDDILDNAVRKKMYLALTEKIADISPELKALNTEAKKLYDAQEALGAAASRVSNKDAISLSDWVFGAGALSNPAALPLLAVKKGLAGGRGSDLLLNTSRTLQGKKEKTIEDILNAVKKDMPLEKGINVDLPMGHNLPTFYRKGVQVIERDGRLVSKGEDYTRRDWDTPTPTKRDRLDIWETKGKPMEGVKRELPLDITPTTRIRIDPFEARGRNIEGVNRGEPIPLTPVDMAKIAEELAKMKKQGMLGITR